jgi:hypothetical protein
MNSNEIGLKELQNLRSGVSRSLSQRSLPPRGLRAFEATIKKYISLPSGVSRLGDSAHLRQPLFEANIKKYIFLSQRSLPPRGLRVFEATTKKYIFDSANRINLELARVCNACPPILFYQPPNTLSYLNNNPLSWRAFTTRALLLYFINLQIPFLV